MSDEKLMSKKKPAYPVNDGLDAYLEEYNRKIEIPIFYEDLLRFSGSVVVYDENDEDTLWVRVYYSDLEREEIDQSLKKVYSILLSDGGDSITQYLNVDAVDFCTFGNSKPFRIKIRNILNDNFTYFYVKKTDASRIYGLELEHMFSPNRINFLVYKNTLIEEHIAGIPGDVFIKDFLPDLSDQAKSQIAKEFVKFNERCFVRLLGDMRSYNFVVDITPDIEGSQYRIRAIDFDQQSYEGRKSFYLPQYFKENNPIINLGLQHMSPKTVTQYQLEERSLIAMRAKAEKTRLDDLFEVMVMDQLSFPDKVDLLKKDLEYHHKSKAFDRCRNMGEIVLTNIQLLLKKEFKQSLINLD